MPARSTRSYMTQAVPSNSIRSPRLRCRPAKSSYLPVTTLPSEWRNSIVPRDSTCRRLPQVVRRLDLLDDPGIGLGDVDAAAKGDLRREKRAGPDVELAFARGRRASVCVLALESVANDFRQRGRLSGGHLLAGRAVALRPWLDRRGFGTQRAPDILELWLGRERPQGLHRPRERQCHS